MANSQNSNPDSQPVPNDVQRSPDFEDEINLIDYFRVLWKYKWLIVLGSVLPALIVGLAFFFSPRSYEVTYVYDVSGWNLNERNYNILISRFYSEENLSKIINKLRENGLNKYAELIRNAGNSLDALKNLLKFEPVPSYIDLSKVKVTEPERLMQIRKLTAQLLNMTIVGRPKEDLLKIASVIRSNLENVVPVYLAEEQVNATIRRYRARMADIEENRFELELALKTSGTILTKLKNIRAGTFDKTEGKITLRFDVGVRSEYLPVEYQIQAAESKAIRLEERIVVNEKKYSYYEDLCALNEKLFTEFKNKTFSYYTIQQFHAFLTDLVDSYKDKELKDYLNSYIKRIENRISASVPVTEKPKVYALDKGTVKKSAIVLAISLMLSIFAAFLLEGLKKSQAQTS